MRSATRASLGLWFLSSEQEQPRDACPAHTAAAHWVLLPLPGSLPRAPWTRLSRDRPLLCRLREPGVYTAEGRPESPLTLWVAAVPSAAEQGPVQGWGRLSRPGRHGRSRGHSGAGHRACSVGGRAGSRSQGPWNKIVVRNVCPSARSSHCRCRTEATKGGMHSVSVVPSQASTGGCSLRRLLCPLALLVRNSRAACPHSTCRCSLIGAHPSECV